jgi:hypothetical protein
MLLSWTDAVLGPIHTTPIFEGCQTYSTLNMLKINCNNNVSVKNIFIHVGLSWVLRAKHVVDPPPILAAGGPASSGPGTGDGRQVDRKPSRFPDTAQFTPITNGLTLENNLYVLCILCILYYTTHIPCTHPFGGLFFFASLEKPFGVLDTISTVLRMSTGHLVWLIQRLDAAHTQNASLPLWRFRRSRRSRLRWWL